jgi:hypothetical protein
MTRAMQPIMADMSQQEEQSVAADDAAGGHGAAQQQQQPQLEGHCGQGSESAMKHLREWELRRAGNNGGKHRQGGN